MGFVSDIATGIFGGGGPPTVDESKKYTPKQIANPYLQRNLEEWQKAGQAPAQQIGLGESQFRGQQQGLADMLQAQAEGRGPSVAQQQLQAGQQQNIQAMMAAAASQRGRMGAGTGAKTLQDAMSQQQLATNQQAAQLRAYEQLGAMGQLGGVLQGARGQDVSLQQSNLQAQQAQAQLAQRYQAMGYDAQTADLQAQRDYQQMLANQALQWESLRTQQGLGAWEQKAKASGGLLSALGTAGASMAVPGLTGF